MRYDSLRAALLMGVSGMLATACVVAPSPDAPPPPRADVLQPDARVIRYGERGADVLQNPAVRDKLPILFGPDWTGDGTGRRLTLSAAEFFSRAEPPRLVQTAGATYVAVPGCALRACGAYRSMLLIREDGSEILSRLDEGGFSHYYAYGPGANVNPSTRALMDGAWRALQPGLGSTAPGGTRS